MRTTILVVVMATYACSGRPSSPPHEPSKPVSNSEANPTLRKKIADIWVMATWREPEAEELDRWTREIAKDRARFESLASLLLEDQTFSNEVASHLLLQKMLLPSKFVTPDRLVLRSFESDKGPIYYLREKCSPSESEEVHPWWSLDEKINICPSSHRPNYHGSALVGEGPGSTTPIGGCESLVGQGSDDKCGCGPKLIYCYRDREMIQRSREGLVNELKYTIGRIVADDRPLREVFQTNETMQDRYVRLEYFRTRLAANTALEVPDYRDWPESPTWQPRKESVKGQHAGILTAPNFIYFGDGRRDRMRLMQDKTWCAEPSGVLVDAHEVLKIPAVSLRNGKGWEFLAKRPICTDCHARLDYGMQFFWGFGPALVSRAFKPADQNRGVQKLYVRNINDLRGEAEAVPANYAKLMVAQPEFSSCMVTRVSDYVFNGRAAPSDEQYMEERFSSSPTMKTLMTAALRRYLESPPRVAPLPSSDASSTEVKKNPVASPALASAYDEHCSDCHSDSRYFSGSTWSYDPENPQFPRKLAVRMLTQVAYGGMPKGGLDRGSRLKLIRTYVTALWPEPKEQGKALAFFLDDWMQPAAHSMGAVLARQAEHARAQDTDATETRRVFAVENYVRQRDLRLNPGYLGLAGLDALYLCRKKHTKNSSDLRKCIDEVLSLDSMVKGTLERDAP